MFEQKHHPLLPKAQFVNRMLFSTSLGLTIVAISLFIGMLGYHYFENLSWIDSFVNAAMILSGMGPLNQMKTDVGKIFAGCFS